MRLGILIEGQEGHGWTLWRQIVAAVERLGFESLWRSDHFMSNIDAGRESLETWAALALTAAETTRLRFGPLVCPITFRHPSVLARMAAALDTLSGGRLVLGLGAGWNAAEHRAFGLPFPPLNRRLEMLEEGIEVIARLLGDEAAHFSGRYYRLEGADPRPKPVQRPRLPLLVGGAGDGALRIVARHADEWDVSGGLDPLAYRARRERLAELCREINRDPGQIVHCLSTAYLIGRDEPELAERAAALQRLIPSLAGLDAAQVPSYLKSIGWRVGTPEQIADALRSLAAEGVQRVILQHNDQDDFDALELVAREVMRNLTP
ncbi:MAG TPA: LLM class flavin-dependent oxidoreductase [Chloroflexota bacterium]|nr:LLM class flavin-dependent oxidoreductase [Chloroflexota bacterium]